MPAPSTSSLPEPDPDGDAGPDERVPVDEPMPVDDPAATREQLVGDAASAWADELRRLVGRDPLLHYRDSPTATLDLTHTHPSGLAMLLAGRPCRLSTLVREPAALADARRRARGVQARQSALAAERGLRSGWLAVGIATWQVPDDEPAPAAPVLLRSCRLRPRGAAGDDVDLDLGSQILLNPVLVSAMAQVGVHLDADVIAELALAEDGFDPRPVLDRVARTCRRVPGFGIEDRYVVSAFVTTFPSLLAGVTDPESLAALTRHDVVAALAGDADAAAAVGDAPGEEASHAAAREVEANLVLDADAAQERALATVVAGSHLVLDAPPGTGATQTIANLVAVLAAAGRRVLLVSQKRAAIDGVLSRLDDVGLRDLVLDLPNGGADRRRVARELAQALDRAGAVPRPEPSDVVSRREQLRGRLDDHAAALHELRAPWGSSAYDAQLALAELTSRRPAPRSRVRVAGEDLQHLDAAQLARLHDELRAAAESGVFDAAPADDPWFGARLVTQQEADDALARVTRLSEQTLPQARGRLGAVLAEAGMPPARDVGDWARALSLLADVRTTLDVFSAKVYDTSLTDVVAATGSAAWRSEHGVRTGALQRRKLRRHARSLLRPGRPPADLHDTLVRAADQRRRWQELVGRGAVPRLPSGLAAAEQAYAAVREDLEWLAGRLSGTPAGGDLLTADLDALAGRLQLLLDRPTSLALVPTTEALRDRLVEAGLEPLLEDLAHRHVSAKDVGAELDLVWWTSLLQHVAQTDPRYGQHDGDALREAARQFADADRACLALAAQQLHRTVAGRVVRTLDRHGDQARLVRAEAARDRRWRSLPDLVRDAPDVLAAAHPCWAMSPLVVGQALPPDAQFDVVVVDEASLCSVGEAVAAIARGRQVVVVGDRRQLAPSGVLPYDDADDEQPRPAGVLDRLSDLLPVVSLRSAHGVENEHVMAFANSSAYGGHLTMLPSASTEQVLSLHVVEGTAMLVAGQDAVESTDAEVERVVELVIDHARTRPHESLGVIALTAVHAARIEAAVRLELSRHPRVAAFVAADRPGAFFVKAAEHACGDTRDAIILTVGFGRTPHGRVLHRFGAVSRDGGERLLTTATTRARRRLTVVAAFEAGDLDPDRLTAPGARMLRDLLQHVAAAADPVAPGTSGAAPGASDLLLADLAVRLRAEHLDVRERYGASAEPIDVAVCDESGAWRVAVESDGPSYAAACARERDRLRPAELARRGWTHQRVWSTDLFRDPAREVARVRGAARGGQRTTRPGAHRDEPARPARSQQPEGVRWDSEGAGPEQPGSAGPAAGTSASPWTAIAPQRRGARPRVPTGRAVEDYRDDELDAVVAWICSDTLLRTREQLAALVRQQLGLVRRSSRVDAAVAAAITRVVARGDARTADAPGAPAGTSASEAGRRRAGERVDPHDPHERWLLDQRPPHWD